ncbi:MAG TPA: hypothetical protein VD929_05580 [Caulobacteraceae bacterium]|nr:hypothetical protein [Caulobacteraceae bacterium]
MRFLPASRACALAFLLAFSSFSLAPPAAYAQAAQGKWENENYDFVEIKGQSFALSVTDANGTSIFAQGRVAGRAPAPDGGTDVTLKPDTVGGARKGAYATMVLHVSADGSAAELFDAGGGGRRSMLKLAK